VWGRIDAALAEPVESGPPEWACYNCGSMGDFSPIQYPDGDYDIECANCGSQDTDEAGNVVSQLVLDLDKARAERDEARDEVETLRAAIDGEPWGGAVLRQQRDEAIKKLGVTLEQVWAAEKDRDEARAEIASLKAELSPMLLAVATSTDERDIARAKAEMAYQRGAEAMRTKILGLLAVMSLDSKPQVNGYGLWDRIRTLGLPEEKP
jgi:hypothetical protein